MAKSICTYRPLVYYVNEYLTPCNVVTNVLKISVYAHTSKILRHFFFIKKLYPQ